MTLTLLIDLDNTLLSNDMETFLPAYLRVLAGSLVDYADPQPLVENLLYATRRMVENRRPDCTLIEVFDSAFYPALGQTSQSMQAAVEQFYSNIFPTLKKLTRPVPQAKQLVEQAFERGYHVVVATNPLFPRPAILQRLEWAGLSPDSYPFDLITSVEQFHFSKPHPAFLAECLALLGWPDGPVVMVGDNQVNDIRAARQLGLPAYWVTSSPTAGGGSSEDPSASGPLEGLFPWIDSLPADALQPDYSSPSALLALLRANPAALDSLLRPKEDSVWMKRPKPEEWTQTEILCHLRDVEAEVNLPRIQKVLQERNPFIPGIDSDPWAEERLYICQNGPEALHHFIAARLKLLDLLENLPVPDWERQARHAIFGPTQLKELVSIIANHDRLHVQQVHQGLNNNN